MHKISPKTRDELIAVTSLLLIGYGFLICATNRTEYTLFINSVSLPRIALGAGLASIGWSILMIRFGIREERPDRQRKRETRKR